MENKTTEQLLNNVIGQLNGVKKMMGEEKDCVAVLSQMKAAKSAIASIMDKYVQENATSCLEDVGSENKVTLLKLIKELSKR
ncbi:MAG: metal-sensitive transcriptional regulator [Patescibacteria group bacterium]